MLKLISCEFDHDTACVEMRFSKNVSLSINCDVIESLYAHTVQQRCDLDYLVYNARSIRQEDRQYCINHWGEFYVPFIFATNGRKYLDQLLKKQLSMAKDLRCSQWRLVPAKPARFWA